MAFPKISVIVPVYNAEKYLHRCIDSILAQTFTDFELLLIDDGSKDRSGAICDEYAVKDSRVRVFHKENGGSTSARALGVNNSQADWLTFVDSDDELEVFCLSQFAKNVSDDIDIIVGFHEEVNIENTEMTIEQYRGWCISGFNIGPHCKLYRKNLFSKYIFDIPKDIRLGEDWIMNIRLSFATNRKVRVLKDKNKIYHYHSDNDNQITKRVSYTLESVERFFQYYERSIPQDMNDCFIKEICQAKMYHILWLVKLSYKTPVEKTTYYKFLLSNREQCGFSIKQRIKILMCGSMATRYLLKKRLLKTL